MNCSVYLSSYLFYCNACKGLTSLVWYCYQKVVAVMTASDAWCCTCISLPPSFVCLHLCRIWPNCLCLCRTVKLQLQHFTMEFSSALSLKAEDSVCGVWDPWCHVLYNAYRMCLLSGCIVSTEHLYAVTYCTQRSQGRISLSNELCSSFPPIRSMSLLSTCDHIMCICLCPPSVHTHTLSYTQSESESLTLQKFVFLYNIW